MKTIKFIGGPADGRTHYSTASHGTTWDIPYRPAWDGEGQPVAFPVAHYVLAYDDQLTAIYEYEGDR